MTRGHVPPSSTAPQSAGCIRASVRISVDLPMPLGPSRHTSSPESAVRLTRSSTARRCRRLR